MIGDWQDGYDCVRAEVLKKVEKCKRYFPTENCQMCENGDGDYININELKQKIQALKEKAK